MDALVRTAILLLLVSAASAGPKPITLIARQPPPQGFGVAIGYGLGGEHELDQLGPVWYLDYDYRGSSLGDHRRILLVDPKSKMESVVALARTRGGQWWQIGNEPNDPNQDNLTPAEYAQVYHDFYYALRRADPTAQILPAGLADADWTWAEAFRNAYRRAFGQFPKTDGWSIHNYLLETCEGAWDVAAFQARITSFRDWMSKIGDGSKPLFLTEFGVLYGDGCCGCPVAQPSETVEYIRSTTRWLASTDYVQAWAWFAVKTDGRYNGDLFDGSGQITGFGIAYRDALIESAEYRRR